MRRFFSFIPVSLFDYAVGMTIRGEPAVGRDRFAPQPCIRWAVTTLTMMQSCASAAKLRGGGPILHNGVKAVVSPGTPPPRTVIGDLSRACGQGRKPSGVFLATPPSVCGTEDEALGHDAIAYEVPQGDE